MKKHILLSAFFGTALLLLAGCSGNKAVNKADGQQLFIGEDIAVANTQYGKVRGYILRDLYTFKGIPYGANTTGKNRFMPPQEPEPWDGVRLALNYGDMAPQAIVYDRSPESAAGFVDNWNFFNSSEDCLRLNVWTHGLDAKKRPVLVYFHGGGFFNGSAIEQDGYSGEGLASYGDVVVCSVNHRLNAFGFTDLAKVGGEKYAHSGNVGILDLIAALKWVHNNIANFGGDPDNVTIMGQSGGGAKVSIVAAMSAAKGLVHKAVCLSGNSIQVADKAQAEALGAFVLQEAGLKPSEIDKLQEMPWEEYYDLANAAAAKFNRMNGGSGRRGGFSPVGDGLDIPAGTFYDPADETIPNIPMIYCSVKHEGNPDRNNPELENVTLDDVVERMTPNYRENARAVVEAYAKTFPECRPIEIWALLTGVRTNIVRSANRKYEQGAPVYVAWFGWQPPLFDGRLRSFHCLDICFWLHNTDLMLTHTGGGARPRALSDKMSDALVAFMRTGDPNCKSLPTWPKYTPENGEVMVLDDECVAMNDPDRPARQVIENIQR
ncbi:MAG: carboxylesterase family protein [Bacteroidales bacterium]|nr:carboxylesterase family protein [Bacteroidales bacterium]